MDTVGAFNAEVNPSEMLVPVAGYPIKCVFACGNRTPPPFDNPWSAEIGLRLMDQSPPFLSTHSCLMPISIPPALEPLREQTADI